MGLSSLTLFSDHRAGIAAEAAACAADIKKIHEMSAFSIKSIVLAAADAKALKEISFIRLSLQPPCVAAAVHAPARVQRCLMFHGMFWRFGSLE
jgi:hypothetical protein